MKKTMTMVTALVMAACMASCGSVNEKATNTAAKNDTSARAPCYCLFLPFLQQSRCCRGDKSYGCKQHRYCICAGFRVTGESPKTLRDQVFQLASIIPACIYFYRSTCYFSDSVI